MAVTLNPTDCRAGLASSASDSLRRCSEIEIINGHFEFGDLGDLKVISMKQLQKDQALLEIGRGEESKEDPKPGDRGR